MNLNNVNLNQLIRPPERQQKLHKLAILDLFEQGSLTANLIELTLWNLVSLIKSGYKSAE